MKFLYFKLFLESIKILLNVNIPTKICKSNDKFFKIGERYNKDNSFCKICICTSDDFEICNEIKSCKYLNCENKHEYELKCCNLLSCESIWII